MRLKGLVLLFGILVGLLSGCSGDPQKSGSSSESADGIRRMIWRFPAEMSHLNPIIDSDYYAMKLEAFLFDTLLDRDSKTLESIPYVAKSWEISEDKKTYTFHLREDVVFSDGHPLTSEDVKFSFDKIKDPKIDAAPLRNYFEGVDTCEAPDPYTVRFTCNKLYYLHLIMLGGIPILPKHIYGVGDFNTHPNNRSPVGSGRYVFDKWDTGAQVVLKKSPKNWNLRPEPLWDEIVVKFIIDDSSSFQVLSRGELDVAEVTPDQWKNQTDTPEFNALFNKYTYFRTSFTYIGWNMRLPQFADKRVRQALTMMLDRDTIVDTIYEGLARVATGNFLPGTPAYDDSLKPWPFDPARATTLLDEAGWKDSNGNGTRDKDGVELRFNIMTTAQNPLAERILTVFKEELERNGVSMDIRQLEWASMVERVQARDFEAMTMGWHTGADNDPYQIWHSTQAENGSNYVNFNNPEADKIIEEARVTFDEAKRNEMYKRFQQILHEEQPYTFLMIPKERLVAGKKIENVNIYATGVDEREWFMK